RPPRHRQRGTGRARASRRDARGSSAHRAQDLGGNPDGEAVVSGHTPSSSTSPRQPTQGGSMSTLKIWMNGTLVPEPEAKLPINSAAVFYATNVFEGLRAYWNAADDELYCFRLAEHFARFRESMKMMRFTIPFSDDDLFEAVREVLSGNELREDIHMHMVAYATGT